MKVLFRFCFVLVLISLLISSIEAKTQNDTNELVNSCLKQCEADSDQLVQLTNTLLQINGLSASQVPGISSVYTDKAKCKSQCMSIVQNAKRTAEAALRAARSAPNYYSSYTPMPGYYSNSMSSPNYKWGGSTSQCTINWINCKKACDFAPNYGTDSFYYDRKHFCHKQCDIQKSACEY